MRINSKKGFTLAELLVVITLFSTVMLITSALYTRFASSERRLSTENELYEETRFTLERIVKEFREGTIDYEEYWNQANQGNGDCILYSSGSTIYQESYGLYGQCYKDYSNQFYGLNSLNTGQNPNTGDSDDLNAVSTSGSNDYLQSELYIINNAGNQKTFLRCLECDSNPDNGIGRLQILALKGYDLGYSGASNLATKNDGVIDSWFCDKDYTCSGNLSDGSEFGEVLLNNNDGWTDYSPPSLDITDLKFYIAPLEDPRKAYNENSPSIQMQPHLTVIISAQTAKDKFRGIPGKVPSLTLQTTISGRVFNEVK